MPFVVRGDFCIDASESERQQAGVYRNLACGQVGSDESVSWCSSIHAQVFVKRGIRLNFSQANIELCLNNFCQPYPDIFI